MFRGKARYLEKLTSQLQFKSVEVGQEMEGSSPPSVFVGRAGYPKVYVGPMMSLQEESALLDLPEAWIDSVKSNSEIVNFRMQLVRGKQLTGIKEENSFVEKMRDIALAKNSVHVDAEFEKKPRGTFFHEDMQPFGPSAALKNLETENARYDPLLEKAYYDTDLKARDAILSLNDKGILFSKIQKALSVGAFGRKRARRLVPTRWSITAADSTLSDASIEELKHNPIIDTFRVYEFASMKNYFSILLMPTPWQYEFIEAFIRVLSDEIMIFSDFETHFTKKEYASIGGCYYSARLGISEALEREGKQAGAVIFRESYPGYIPLGVWNVRENVRKAMLQQPLEFSSMNGALAHMNRKLYLPLHRWLRQSQILKRTRQQKALASFG
ncbi:MAG TPA: hypothetical protein HA282_01215 [Nanoarchaeota archaeon]|nr:hypothetical protein [Candidatus Pacearchaeota archaeon]HIH17971.1 hypothetical protein [Nanoarchaeota archaeon]HIH33839.1 hypothetical protein [Nanoarchaeota archaeon]HIH50782.1 hypothetical protein [Nanoarchaeota archaeon]HIH65818.1 hypothetical protein [Nanoarchaeota archaeon]